jgi:uncharacterized protein (DUF58 family)
MIFFILSVLAVFTIAFLVMTAIQLIRIERVISECADIAEVKVRKMYGKS